MKKIIKVLLVIIILFSGSVVFADTNIHLNIETNTGSIYNENITVIPCDSDNDPATPDTESAYCALVQSGIASDWSGLWVNSINGIVNNNDNNENNDNKEQNIVPDSSALDVCPHQEIIKIYHEELPQLRKVKVWNDARMAFLRARWREDEERWLGKSWIR
jgi:hypothetical protein